MADEELVTGHGYISDDSSFYGTEEEQQRQSELCGEINATQFWRAHPKDINFIATKARLLATTKRTAKPPTSGDALPPKSAVGETASAVNDESFNFTGSDRKVMEQERLARLGKRKREPSPESLPTLELFNPLQGRSDAWQLGEPVEDFIRRLPPFTTSIFICHWIWAKNPHRNPRDKSPCPRVDDFTTCGAALLEQSLNTRRDIQKAGAVQPRGMVNRQLNQESKALQERITSLAKETHVLTGKWMLFPKSVDVTRVWKQVVTGTVNNILGSSCKVATDDGNEERLICVYTKDFQDTHDVLRVLQELEEMGVFSGRVIYYKPDTYTYLDLRRESAAQYGLQASLYNSRTMMAGSKAAKPDSLPQKKQSNLESYF